MAEDLDLDSVHEAGVSVRPAALEGAALELSDVERTELIRLIHEEMKRTES
jgi:hypothetical protein